jgi:quercetin dioxygenase-like cupin family protein
MSMTQVNLSDVQWSEIAPGVERGHLRSTQHGAGTSLLRFAAGATTGDHRHPAGEELFLFSGRIRIGDTVLGPGDYLYTAPGGVNDAEAYEDSLLFQVQEQPPEYL